MLETIIGDAVEKAVGNTIAAEVEEIVAKETRRLFIKHEEALTLLIKTSVGKAFARMLGLEEAAS